MDEREEAEASGSRSAGGGKKPLPRCDNDAEGRWRAIMRRLRDMEAGRAAVAGARCRRRPFAVSRRVAMAGAWRAGRAEGGGGLADMAGRGLARRGGGPSGFGAGAGDAGARIALVGGSLDEVARVMVEGESGLLKVARSDEVAVWRPTLGELLFPSGAVGQAYSGAHPGKLRGPQHHFAWCDELAKWRHPAAAWANLRMGMRLGERPRIVVTTTPAPVAALKAIAAGPDTQVTKGRTADNPHLPADFQAAMAATLAGTRLGGRAGRGAVRG